MDTLIALCAKYLIWVVVLLGVVFWFTSRDKVRLGMAAIFSMALTYGFGKLASHFWYDTRPFVINHFTPIISHAADNGFPSDHMLLGAAIASVVFVYNRTWGIALWVLAFIVGAARVLAGIHHVVDLFGSIVCAIVAVAIVEFVVRRFWARSSANSSAVQ
jgi:undecaprenyl-diphosphatase